MLPRPPKLARQGHIPVDLRPCKGATLRAQLIAQACKFPLRLTRSWRAIGHSSRKPIWWSKNALAFSTVAACVLILFTSSFFPLFIRTTNEQHILDKHLPLKMRLQVMVLTRQMVMSGFFEELQRRKVYRVAAAYIVVAGFLIQIASAVFPAWELPSWSLRLVIALLLIGFPIALILAWAYDVTPQGIQATARVPGAHRRRNLILLVATGAIISTAAGFFLLPRASARKIDKSIAVLPFQNLSEEKANAYFAEGIQNEILTKLAAIRDLKVISRTSTAKYQSKPDDLKTVAQELGVSTILEGAVQRAGDKVRVNVQLIDARTDTHLWAKSYDRDLKDVLAVESEVSQRNCGGVASEAFAKRISCSGLSRGHVTRKLTIFFCEASMSFTKPKAVWPQTPTIVPTRFTDRRWHAIQILPRLLRRSRRSRLSRHWFVSPLTASGIRGGEVAH